MNYLEAIEFLYSQLPMFQRDGQKAYKPNLNNIIALCEAVGNPQKKIKCIHVAGSNGKGSSSHFLASILQEAGYKVGLFTSPHLKDFRERIKINGQDISEESVIDFTVNNKLNFERIKPSFFEMSTALAFHEFAKAQVDIAVIETGLGGRLDSTNIIDPEVCLITNISFDHMDILGDTLEKIAFEKAGIIKSTKPVVISEFQENTAPVFIAKAASVGSQLYFAAKEFQVDNSERNENGLRIKFNRWPWINSPLRGTYQEKNLKGVLKVIDLLRSTAWNISEKAVIDGISGVIKNTNLMGRWQILSENPRIICDTGHNEDGIKEVIKNLELENFKKLHFVLGMVGDKDVNAVLKLLPKSAQYYFCKASIPRALNEHLLKEKAEVFGLNGSCFSNVELAVTEAKESYKKGDLIFIGGSTFVVAEAV